MSLALSHQLPRTADARRQAELAVVRRASVSISPVSYFYGYWFSRWRA
jgi:hypothetical protein